MAERRMFAKSIIDSDNFLEMPQTTQNLYFHLSMRADDDGFINNPKSIMRTVGCSNDDMKVLISRQFIIPFESGVVVVKHWRVHNYIQKDRYKETVFFDEKNLLEVDKNNIYQTLDTDCIQNVSIMDTQDRLGKDRLGKDRLESEGAKLPTPNPSRHKYGEYKNVLFSDDEFEKLKTEFPNDWNERIERLSEYIASSGKSYKNHLATIRRWAKTESDKNHPNTKKNKFANYNDTNKPDYSDFGERLIKEMLED